MSYNITFDCGFRIFCSFFDKNLLNSIVRLSHFNKEENISAGSENRPSLTELGLVLERGMITGSAIAPTTHWESWSFSVLVPQSSFGKSQEAIYLDQNAFEDSY